MIMMMKRLLKTQIGRLLLKKAQNAIVVWNKYKQASKND